MADTPAKKEEVVTRKTTTVPTPKTTVQEKTTERVVSTDTPKIPSNEGEAEEKNLPPGIAPEQADKVPDPNEAKDPKK